MSQNQRRHKEVERGDPLDSPTSCRKSVMKEWTGKWTHVYEAPYSVSTGHDGLGGLS